MGTGGSRIANPRCRWFDLRLQLGATGWNWDSLLPYFKKSESVAPPTQQQIDPIPRALLPSDAEFDAFHGRSGPIHVRHLVCKFTFNA